MCHTWYGIRHHGVNKTYAQHRVPHADVFTNYLLYVAFHLLITWIYIYRETLFKHYSLVTKIPSKCASLTKSHTCATGMRLIHNALDQIERFVTCFRIGCCYSYRFRYHHRHHNRRYHHHYHYCYYMIIIIVIIIIVSIIIIIIIIIINIITISNS